MHTICSKTPTSAAGCIQLARAIAMYMDLVGNSYDLNPEQKSQMLLTIMELWAAMDKTAIELFPLLQEYEPVFSPSHFDILQISRLCDMHRLNTVRLYLKSRHERAGAFGMNIFANPAKGCFGERYYNESLDSYALQKAHTKIEDAAKAARERKIQQWMTMSAEYEEKVKISSQSTCLYRTDANGQVRHNERGCGKCTNQRQLDTFRKIRVQEHPLPADEAEAKTVVSWQYNNIC